MLKSSFAVFLNLLNALLVNSAGNERVTGYLPLIMIQHDGLLQYPKELKNVILSEDQQSLRDLQFSRNDLHFNQIFFCPTDSVERKNQIEQANEFLAKSKQLQAHYGNMKIGKSCLFKSEFKQGEPVQCTVEAVPVIYEVINEGTDQTNDTPPPVQCGPENKGTLFQFVYDVCPPIEIVTRIGTFLRNIAKGEIRNFTTNISFNYERQKIYEICYDLEAKRTIYTKHELPVIRLLQNKNLKHDREKKYPFFADNYGYEFFGTNFQEDVEFYKKLAIGPDQDNEDLSDIQAEFKFEPHQLVPSLDMMSAILGKPTFHYINIQSMHEQMTELWTYIEDLIRKNLDDDSSIPYQVYTGAFAISENSKTTKIPDVWIKIVHMPKPKHTKWDFSLAIAMKNDYKPVEDDTFLNRFCEKKDDQCGVFRQNEKAKEFEHRLEHVRCCSVNKYIDDLFGSSNLYGNHVLKISNLTPLVPVKVAYVSTETTQK